MKINTIIRLLDDKYKKIDLDFDKKFGTFITNSTILTAYIKFTYAPASKT
jgi:hypothetical protein